MRDGIIFGVGVCCGATLMIVYDYFQTWRYWRKLRRLYPESGFWNTKEGRNVP